MDKPNKFKSYLKLIKTHRGCSAAAYDQVGAGYDDFVKIWDHFAASSAIAHFDELIKNKVKPGATVLDAGAGTGERTLSLLQNSQPAAVIDLDSSAVMLDVARSKIDDVRVRFVQGDASSLPYADNTFDAVISTWMIEILSDPWQAVQEFIRVIKEDGIVLYAFCSLPEGKLGNALAYVTEKLKLSNTLLSHLLTVKEQPFHNCKYSSIQQFSGGFTTVAAVSKCCSVVNSHLPCHKAGKED